MVRGRRSSGRDSNHGAAGSWLKGTVSVGRHEHRIDAVFNVFAQESNARVTHRDIEAGNMVARRSRIGTRPLSNVFVERHNRWIDVRPENVLKSLVRALR